MKKKIIIFGAILAVFLMLMSPSISASIFDEEGPNTLELDDEVNNEQDGIDADIDEVNNEQDDVKPIPIEGIEPIGGEPTGLFFCTLRVWTYAYFNPPVGQINYPGVRLKVEDLDTGKIRYGTTGLMGHKTFYGLQIGHDYKISAPDFDAEKVINNALHYEWVNLCVN